MLCDESNDWPLGCKQGVLAAICASWDGFDWCDLVGRAFA